MRKRKEPFGATLRLQWVGWGGVCGAAAEPFPLLSKSVPRYSQHPIQRLLGLNTNVIRNSHHR